VVELGVAPANGVGHILSLGPGQITVRGRLLAQVVKFTAAAGHANVQEVFDAAHLAPPEILADGDVSALGEHTVRRALLATLGIAVDQQRTAVP
jgi:hypothetical protein